MSSTTISQPSLQVVAHALAQSGTFPIKTCTVNHAPNISIGTGSAGGSIDTVAQVALSVTNGTPYTINMSTGLDLLGQTLSMQHVTMVLVENDSTTTGQDFTIGGGTHPILGTDQFTAQANGGVGLVCNPNPGYTVSLSSSDTLQVTVAAGSNVPGKLTIFGRSA